MNWGDLLANNINQLKKAEKRAWGRFATTSNQNAIKRANKLSEALRIAKLKNLAKSFTKSKLNNELIKSKERYLRLRKQAMEFETPSKKNFGVGTMEASDFFHKSTVVRRKLLIALNRHKQLQAIAKFVK